MPDTAANQAVYPQESQQKPGCGFPLLRLLGVFSLSTGVLLDYAKGNKHQSELRLLKGLLDPFKPGDLAVGVYESLVNTTMGLFIALVFLTAYFVFKNNVSKMALSINLQAVEMLKHLAGRKHSVAA